MNNLKSSLLDELVRERGYLEMEFAGLAQNQHITYKEKVIRMNKVLKDIAIINGTFGLVEHYIPEPKAATPAPQAPVKEVVNEPIVEVESTQEPVEEKATKKSAKDSKSPFPKID